MDKIVQISVKTYSKTLDFYHIKHRFQDRRAVRNERRSCRES